MFSTRFALGPALHRSFTWHRKCPTDSSETSGVCQVCTSFQISAQGKLCSVSNTLILSTALQVATHTPPESAKRLWAVTTRSKSHPYLTELVVEKKTAKNSKG